MLVALPPDRGIVWKYSNGKQLAIFRGKAGLFVPKGRKGQNTGYVIKLEQTTVTFGMRFWYLCPICHRRCALLYLAGDLACRRCVNPAYESQNTTRLNYLADHIRTLRKQLWPEANWNTSDLSSGSQYRPKPKGKHWRTYETEQQRIIDLEQERERLWFKSAIALLNRQRRKNGDSKSL